MKGLDKLKEKLPDYQGTKIRKFLFVAFIVFSSSLFFQLMADSLPRVFSNIDILQILAPFFPILGSIIILSIGFTLVHSFWRARDKYLSEFGELAYQKAFKFVVTSIPMIISVTVHGLFPSDFLVPFSDSQNLNWYLAYPILDLFFNFSITSLVIRLLFFFSLFSFFLVFMSKTLKVFGIDYIGLVYIYYPEDYTIQKNEIYFILRHPKYHSLMLICIGVMLL